MKLEIPFFRQTTLFNCGPSALRMVLAYFEKDPGIKILEEKTGIKEGKAVFTIKLGTVAKSFGYSANFFSKSLKFNSQYLEMNYYKKYGSGNEASELDILVDEAKKAGVNVQEKTIDINQLLNFVSEKSVPIVLLDWNIVEDRKEKGYQGHFVVIAGYDKKNVYVQNPSSADTIGLTSISRELFDKARKSNGTDEDIVIIYKK